MRFSCLQSRNFNQKELTFSTDKKPEMKIPRRKGKLDFQQAVLYKNMIRSNTSYNLCIKLTSKISQHRTIITIIKKTGPSDKTVFIDLEFDLTEQLFFLPT